MLNQAFPSLANNPWVQAAAGTVGFGAKLQRERVRREEKEKFRFKSMWKRADEYNGFGNPDDDNPMRGHLG